MGLGPPSGFEDPWWAKAHPTKPCRGRLNRRGGVYPLPSSAKPRISDSIYKTAHRGGGREFRIPNSEFIPGWRRNAMEPRRGDRWIARGVSPGSCVPLRSKASVSPRNQGRLFIESPRRGRQKNPDDVASTGRIQRRAGIHPAPTVEWPASTPIAHWWARKPNGEAMVPTTRGVGREFRNPKSEFRIFLGRRSSFHQR